METKKTSRFQRFLYIILIPLLFTLILSGVVLSILGVPVIGKMISAFHSLQLHSRATHAQITSTQKSAQDEKVITKLKSENDQLNADLTAKNHQIATLQQQAVQLQQKIEAANQVTQNYQDQAKVYAAMQPDQAAAIIQNLPENIALQVLSHLTQPAEAAILNKMDPKIAANYLAKLAQ